MISVSPGRKDDRALCVRRSSWKPWQTVGVLRSCVTELGEFCEQVGMPPTDTGWDGRGSHLTKYVTFVLFLKQSVLKAWVPDPKYAEEKSNNRGPFLWTEGNKERCQNESMDAYSHRRWFELKESRARGRQRRAKRLACKAFDEGVICWNTARRESEPAERAIARTFQIAGPAAGPRCSLGSFQESPRPILNLHDHLWLQIAQGVRSMCRGYLGRLTPGGEAVGQEEWLLFSTLYISIF